MFEVLKINPTYAVKYAHPEREDLANRITPQRPSYNYTGGNLSKQSRKQLSNAINWMILFSPEHSTYCLIEKKWFKFKINFITLTLSAFQKHTDHYIKEHMLAPFLKWIVRKGASVYAWKAETQNNGNIHFHITTNFYLHWQSVRNKWNQLQQKEGYLRDYMANGGDDNPNSTDIHAVRKPHKLVGYMIKYMLKNEHWCKGKGTFKEYPSISTRFENLPGKSAFPVPKRKINGRLWAISNNLTKISCFISEKQKTYREDANEFLKYQMKSKHSKYIKGEFFELFIYPHLCDGKAPQSIIDNIKRWQSFVNSN